MTLTYRGISYQPSQLSVEAQGTEKAIAKYRGQSYQVSNLVAPIQPQNYSLVYRGIAYKSNKNLSVTDENVQSVMNPMFS